LLKFNPKIYLKDLTKENYYFYLMINRYTLVNIEYVRNSFELDEELAKPIYNAFPTKKLPIILIGDNEKVSFNHWGSNDQFSRNNTLAKRLINVDVSKVKKSNILTNQFKTNRCLIPCDGFYFWKNINSIVTRPCFFKYKKDKLTYCIGIMESFEDFSGNKYMYFYFLTSPSSLEWKNFTSRIPLFFDMRYLDIWFNKKSTLKKLLPFTNSLKFNDFSYHIVSPYFENKKIDDKSLIEPKNSLNQYGNYSLFD
jgi:putative SOS response-associated peptidase YedK